MNCLLDGLPETLTARESPAAAVTSINTTGSCACRARRQGRESAAAPAPPSACRNARRDRLQGWTDRSVTSGSRCATLLLQLGALLFELLERLERFPAIVHPAKSPIDASQAVVVRRCAGVEGDGGVERLDGRVEVALAIVRASLLKQRAVGFRIERERAPRVLQRSARIAGLVVIGAQVQD